VEVINEPLRMPILAFHTAWKCAGLGEPHPTIGPNNYYMTDEFAGELERRTLTKLTDLGLASRGMLTRAFRYTLTVLARSSHEFYSWTHLPRSGDAGAILVAALGSNAVRLVTDHAVVLIDPIDPDRLPEHLVETLPTVPGATVQPITVSRSEYDSEYDTAADCDNDDPLAEPADGPVRRLANLMHADRDAAHQIYFATRHGDGPRHRSVPISALDLTNQGRVLTFIGYDSDGKANQIHLTSGTPANLIATLNATQQHL
jgi:EspG family